MKKFFLTKDAINGQKVIVEGDEFLHLSKVLRTEVGEKIQLIFGDEFVYLAEVAEITKRSAICNIIDKEFCLANPKKQICVFQGLPKGEKLELIIQKISELGASQITPFESRFTIAKSNTLKFDRLNKIAREACKQCGRSIPLQINSTVKFSELPLLLKNFDVVLFVYEKAPTFNKLENFTQKLLCANKIAIIIGAEGGFAEDEVFALDKLNVDKVSLGSRILRTETATIAMVGYLNFVINN